MKKTVVIVLSVIFVIIVSAVVTPFLINLNKYKGEIIDIAKPYLARDLDFDSIELTILKGLGAEIRGLRIAENPEFGKGDFLNLERLRIKIKLFPLLKKQIQVKELILDKPVVRLIKNAKGEFNFTDLTSSETKEEENDGSAEKKDRGNEGNGGSSFFAGLMVSRLTLYQGQIDFIDEFIQQGTATTTSIDLLDLKFTDVSLNNPIHLFMAARLPGGTKQNFTIKGDIGPLGNTPDMKRLFMDVTVSLNKLDLNTCKSYLAAGFPFSPVDGSISMDISLKGDMDNLQAHGTIEMKDLDILYGETFRKPKLVPCQISIKASKAGDDIQLDPCIIKMHTLSLRTSGKITGLTNPHFDLLLATDDTSMKGWELLVPALKEYKPEGNFVFRSSLKGTMEDVSANLQLSSPMLAFDLSQPSGDKQKAVTSKSFFESVDMRVQVEKKTDSIRGNGNFAIKKGEGMSVPFERMQAQFDYQNDILGIHGFQVHAFQGDVSMDGKVKPGKLLWNVKPVITNIHVAEVMDNLTPYKGLFKGIFSGSFTANNAGGGKQKDAVNASGSFRLDQGEIMNLNLVDTALDSLFGIKGVSKFLEKEGSALDKQKITRFDYLDGDFSMVSNKIDVKKITLHNIQTAKATDSDAFIEGLVDCNTSSLDLKGKIVLSEEYSAKLTKKAEPLHALLNPENRMVLPITVTGSFNRPKPILDIPYVTSAIAKYYGKRELEKLGDKIGLPKKGDKEQVGKESPLGNILKDLLK